MAGLCNVRILLLWVGIISLVNCQDSSGETGNGNGLENSNPSPPHTTAVSTSPSLSTVSVISSPASTAAKSTSPSVPIVSITPSPPHTMAAAPAMSSDTPTAAAQPPLISSAPTSVSPNQTNNSTTMSATPTTHPNKTNIQTDSDNKTSPAVTQLNTTVTPTTQAPPTTSGPPPQCSYTVKSIKFGFQINITSSTTGNYNITINEEGRPDTENKSMVQHSSQNSSHEIKHLKPCTEYKHSVTFLDTSAGRENIHCNSTEKDNKTTIGMSKDDIKDATSCIPAYVCYQTDWDITSLQSTPNKIQDERCGNKTLCVKPDFKNICSDLTTTITSENCGNSSFTKSISIDFLNVSEINQTAPTELPAKINTTLPPNCKSLSIDYNCWERGRVSESKKLSELEPFTDYSCTGQIKDNNRTINKTTAPVQFKIDCDLSITDVNIDATNTSIGLNWTTTSQKCKNVTHDFPKLSYKCICSDRSDIATNKQPSGGTCHVTGLKPYTNYTCKVQPTYNNEDVAKSKEVEERKTEPGIPDQISELRQKASDHDVIHVSCTHSRNFQGPKKIYRGRLLYGDKTVHEINKTICEFEFRDLSYSTTYTVKVTAFNGKLESAPKRHDFDTQYNDKAVIGVLIFLIILIISVVVAVFVYKLYIKKRRESRNGVNEGVTLESTAIYMNVPPREWHHKETH
ncbi:receptor-type tyrosine-protein phosphatase C isoform X21 [Lates calcarifer]|uniref:Receptor-type tyrosine-protein phosphatase C isoform X21 n=1 Tax=Lates calcarifer TaxID=8187 RepID=A0AAJ7QAM4_LATCA|nr:receptor-type tyrosine-protein phosphatase C isoform X21 [Lates calcarifer]